jgi:hypothetical protein
MLMVTMVLIGWSVYYILCLVCCTLFVLYTVGVGAYMGIGIRLRQIFFRGGGGG